MNVKVVQNLINLIKNMKIYKILQKISIEFWLIEKDNNLYIKYNEKSEESDFFHYVFDEKIIEDNFKDWFETYSKDLWKMNIKTWKDNNWEDKQLKWIDSFDKNLNLIILLKLEKSEDFTDELRKQIYQVEKNPYYSNKFVIVYTDEQIEELDILEELDNDNLSKSFDNLLENRQKQKDKQFTKEDFIFDLVTSLHFITFDFKITDWSEILNIFEESSHKLDKSLYIDKIYQELLKIDWDSKDILNEKILKNNDIWEDLSEFEKEIIELSKKLFLDKDFYNIEQTFEEFKTNFKKDDQI